MTSSHARMATVIFVAWLGGVAAAQPRETPPLESAARPVPLMRGLAIVKAVHDPGVGDYETIRVVTAVTAASVAFTISAEMPDGRTLTVRRADRREDLRKAHTYRYWFHTDDPLEFPGTTSLSVSSDVLIELKTTGRTFFTLEGKDETDDVAAGLSGLLGSLLGGQTAGLRTSLTNVSKKSGMLERVGSEPLAVPVLVNGRRVNLPAIHARGQLGDHRADYLLLDDASNPLLLSDVIAITFPTESAERPIEDALKADGRAEVYGIYFDFAKATIRPESEPVLQEIAAVMANNPDWRLTVNGHTDNIGGDSPNLELSKRRSLAVKQALVDRYQIAAARLTTSGFGALRPAETNDTVAGRARNRRVELVRLR